MVRIFYLFFVFLIQRIRCSGTTALEQLLDSQNIQYYSKDEVINIQQKYLNLDLFLENIDVNQCLNLPQLTTFNARIRLVNVNIFVNKQQHVCMALLNSTETIQNMQISEVTLFNVTTSLQLLRLQLDGCNNCLLQAISLTNYISSSALFYFLGALNLKITNFISDMTSILMSQLPIVYITNNVQNVVFEDFQVPSLSLRESNEQIPTLNKFESQIYEESFTSDYNKEQRSFFQIINSKAIDYQNFAVTFSRIYLDFSGYNIRFLEKICTIKISISNSVFKRNQALVNGGSIYSEQEGQIYFNSTVFDSCSSGQFGGAIHAYCIYIEQDTQIINCTSKIGGGVFAFGNGVSIANAQYRNNFAYITQPDSYLCPNEVSGKNGPCSLFSVDQTLEYNTQLYGTSLYMNVDKFTVRRIGAPDRNITQWEVLYGAIQIIKLKIKFGGIEIIDFNENQTLGNLYNYLKDSYKPYYFPLQLQNITYPYLISTYTPNLDCSVKDILFDLDYYRANFGFGKWDGCYQLRSDCNEGMVQFDSISNQQIYTNCQYCGIGLFNYGISNNCTVCNPQFYDFCYANVSIIKNGTWRNQLSTNEKEIYPCNLNPNNCQSTQREGVGNSLCAEGYISNQCLTCDLRGEIWMDSYGETGQFSCAKCSSLSNNSIYFILSMSFQLLLFAFTLYSNQTRMKNQVLRTYLSHLQIIYIGTSFIRQSQTAIYIKILMFNFQIYLTAYFFINFNSKNDSFETNIFSFFNPFQNVGKYSYDCFLNEIFPGNSSIGFVKLKVAFFTPLILSGAILLITLSLIVFRKKRFITLLYIMMHCFSYTILFLFQQSNLLYSISSLKCLQLTNENRYMLLDLNFDCDNSGEVNQIRSLGIISLVFYILTIPLCLFTLLFLQKKNLDKTKVICLYGFLFDEYKRQFYYWQFIKVTLAAVLTILLQELKTYVILAIIIYLSLLSIYAIAIALLKPYQTFNLNKIELSSALLSILYLLATMSMQLSHSQNQQYENNSTSTVISSVLYYLVLVCLTIFYIYMTILIVSSFFQTSIQKLQKYRLFKYIEKRFPSILSKVYSKKLRDNFKLVRQKVLSMNNHSLSNILLELQSSQSHQQLNNEDQMSLSEEKIINSQK